MPDGPGGFAQDYSCPALLRMTLCLIMLRIRGYHPLWHLFPEDSSHNQMYNVALLQPHMRVATQVVWAIPRSLATTGGIIILFYFPRGTKMFQFPRFASLIKHNDDRPSDGRVVPFGNPRIKEHLHLPSAYRSFSRPSPPPSA